MPEAHSTWSASGFEQRMLCPGSHVLQLDAPRTTSPYAAEGTAAHQLLTWCLLENRPAAAYIGRQIQADGMTFEVDDDMAGHVQVCIDYVNDVKGDDGMVIVDRRVNYAKYLGVDKDQAWGTLDVAVVKDTELIVIDFKYGMGVEVQAGDDVGGFGIGGGEVEQVARRPNPQLALYGLGALYEFGEFADFERVRLVISQPRLSRKPSKYDLPVNELEAWGYGEARSAVNTCRNAMEFDDGPYDEFVGVFLRPGEKQCKFCKAKATCPALRDEVADVVGIAAAGPDEFADSPVPKADHIAVADEKWLSAALSKVDLIEDWCSAVRAEVSRRLNQGLPVPGYKLVQGKRGNRKWSDPAAAEAMLKAFRLSTEQMYDMKLISPITAEKLAKAGAIGPRQWPKAEALITQSDGAPSVAPVSDSRPAISVTPVVEDFPDMTEIA